MFEREQLLVRAACSASAAVQLCVCKRPNLHHFCRGSRLTSWSRPPRMRRHAAALWASRTWHSSMRAVTSWLLVARAARCRCERPRLRSAFVRRVQGWCPALSSVHSPDCGIPPHQDNVKLHSSPLAASPEFLQALKHAKIMVSGMDEHSLQIALGNRRLGKLSRAAQNFPDIIRST